MFYLTPSCRSIPRAILLPPLSCSRRSLAYVAQLLLLLVLLVTEQRTTELCTHSSVTVPHICVCIRVCVQLGNLGGAIFYEKTLLCSHLDLDVTRFILTRVESIKTLDYLERHHHQGHLFSSLGRDRDRGLSEPDFTPVYITDEQYNRMFGERDRRAADVAAIPEVREGATAAAAAAAALLGEAFVHREPCWCQSVRYLLDPPPNGLFVGLCIITMCRWPC